MHQTAMQTNPTSALSNFTWASMVCPKAKHRGLTIAGLTVSVAASELLQLVEQKRDVCRQRVVVLVLLQPLQASALQSSRIVKSECRAWQGGARWACRAACSHPLNTRISRRHLQFLARASRSCVAGRHQFA